MIGPPHSTDNPPYGLICSVYRQGGQCTHVQPQWAAANCGFAPRYGYNQRHGYQPRAFDHEPRYRYRREERRVYPFVGEDAPRVQRANPRRDHTVHPDTTPAPTPDRMAPNTAR